MTTTLRRRLDRLLKIAGAGDNTPTLETFAATRGATLNSVDTLLGWLREMQPREGHPGLGRYRSALAALLTGRDVTNALAAHDARRRRGARC